MLTLPNALTAKYTCDGTRYGRGLNLDSCLNAWRRMDDTTVSKSYGERDSDDPGSTDWDANLPLRILSYDGRCAIDVSHSARSPSDTIAPSYLKSYARTLISICLQPSSSPPPTSPSASVGGIVSNIGDNGNLAIRVTKYNPVNVHCTGEAGSGPPWFDCRDSIDAMPTIDTVTGPDGSVRGCG
ncbi:hypothetical protein BDR22DRAFT_975776 [Usnea florida]